MLFLFCIARNKLALASEFGPDAKKSVGNWLFAIDGFCFLCEFLQEYANEVSKLS